MLIIKTGGAQGISDEPLLQDIASLHEQGENIILVHGGSDETSEIATKLGHPPRFVTSVSGFQSRYTDRNTLAIFTMVYCGRRNKAIVERLQQYGVNAVGLSGADGRIFEGPIKTKIKIVEKGRKKVLRGDNTGRVTKVNRQLLDLLLDNGFMPVLSPPAISESDSRLMNVDGDRAAAMLAATYRARALVILSNVPGLLRDIQADAELPGNLVTELDLSTTEDPYALAKGRMKKKIMGAIEAIEQGVESVIVCTANTDNPIKNALQGAGTRIFDGRKSG